MDKLYSWKSDIQNNYFAPKFNVDIWIDYIESDLIDNLLDLVIGKEYLYANDMWEHYNVFSWDEDLIIKLKSIIKTSLQDFFSNLGVNLDSEIWIRGWVYPQKKGMILKRHFHAMHENSFVSGNICLTQNKTTTDYDIPYLGWVEIKNEKGRMTLFPSCLPHSVDKLEEEVRYSLAFDLITKDCMEYFRNNNNKDPNDPLHLCVLL